MDNFEKTKKVKVLTIGSDRKLFKDGSNVQNRILEYAKLMEELHIIVFTSKKHGFKRDKLQIAPNVWLYGTNSVNRWFYISDAIYIGGKILKKENKDFVVSTQDPFESGFVGMILAKKQNVKLQVQIHSDFLSSFFKEESFLNRVRLLLARPVIENADSIRVVSDRIKHSIVNRFKLKVEPVLLPVYTDVESIINRNATLDVHKKFPQFDFIITMSSRLEKVKNIELGVHAFKEIVTDNPKAGLVIVGDGSGRKSLESLVKKLDLTENIVFEGWIDSRDDLISYLKTSDLFLSTSNHEGYGLSLIEAALSGCPIVATSVGVVGDVLNESNIHICDIGDDKCVKSKLVYSIENKDRLKKMSERAYSDVVSNSLSKERYLEAYINSFDELN